MPENDGAGDTPSRHGADTYASTHIVKDTKCASASRSRSPLSGNKRDTANWLTDSWKQEDGCSAGGGAHPADDQQPLLDARDQLPRVDARILEDVRRLGRLPKLFNDPRSQEEKAEHRLADRIRKFWKKLLPTTLASLEEFGPLPLLPRLDAQIRQAVRRLGRLPCRFPRAPNPPNQAERRLAVRIEENKTKLLPATLTFLEKYEPQMSFLDVEIQQFVRRWGRLPKQKKHAKSDQDKAEARLAEGIRRHADKLVPATLTFLKEVRSAKKQISVDAGTLAMCAQGHQRLMPQEKSSQVWCKGCRKMCAWSGWKALLCKESMPENDAAGHPPCRHPVNTHASTHAVEITKRPRVSLSRSRLLGDKKSGNTCNHETGKGLTDSRMPEDGSMAGGGDHPAGDQALDHVIPQKVRRLAHLPEHSEEMTHL